MSDILGGFVFGTIFGFLALGVPLGIWRDGEAEREAVKAGKAEYYLDKEHNRKWRWKP